MDAAPSLAADPQALAERFGAHNYHPIPVVVARAEGVWAYDAAGRRYLDMLSAYSALNFGHRHPALVAAAIEQLGRVTLTSRAFYNDQLGPLCAELAELCGMQMVLPMNTGAEAVETAIKMARKWGVKRRGLAPGTGKIVVCGDNFHGRTTTIISFSTDPQARADFGPYTAGFEVVPFGDLAALQRALDDPLVVAFLVEPIQGEAGVVLPPPGYLAAARALCRARRVLFIADEVQAGLGRTGQSFACTWEDVQPDAYVLGKALGGGIVPISAVVASADALGVFAPGDHGSTFGGNPLACAVARAVVALLRPGTLQAHARAMGARLEAGLRAAALPKVRQIRGRGLWFGIELHPGAGPARATCERLAGAGLLCKDTHQHTLRLAPPLTIEADDVDWAVATLVAALR